MSDPLTSHEIEDVLSSIRRLVSDDLRPAARTDTGPSPRAAGEETGKLLLTPALRVVSAAPSDVGGERDAVPVPSAQDAEAALPDSPIPGYEDEGWNRAEGQDATGGGPVDEPEVEVWPDGTEVLWSSAGAAPDDAEDVILPSPPATEDSGHWTAQDLPGTDWAQDDTDWAEPEPMAFVPHPRKPTLASDPLARAWADRAEAEVRATLGGAEVQAPPADPSRQPDAAARPASPQPDHDAGLFEGDTAEIDEDVLRDIVRDIIREELAGTLGERITRNVRKLVRVEINRALTAREFE